MNKRCPSGEYIIRYGDWVEITTHDDVLIHSFTARSDMCEEMLTRYLVFKADMDPGTEYKIKRRGK